jgi:hypothetical protein
MLKIKEIKKNILIYFKNKKYYIEEFGYPVCFCILKILF